MLNELHFTKFSLEGVFTREISSWDEPCPRMKSSLSMVKCILLFTRFCRDEISSWDELIPGWKTGMKFHPRMKKRKKTRKDFIPGWNFKMSMFLIIFWRVYSNMLSKVNVFEHGESINEWNIRPLYEKVKSRKKRMRTTSKKSKT